MKRTLSLLVVLLLIIPVANIGYAVRKSDTTQEGLPDLVCDLYFIKSENTGYYHTAFTVTNIGDGPAIPSDNFTVKTASYPFGIFPTRDLFAIIISLLPYSLLVLFINIVVLKLHIWPVFLVKSEQWFYEIIDPGETKYGSPCVFPVDQEADEFINAKICIITEIIVDPENRIEESNERNNKKVIRWWLPNIMYPPKP